LEQGVVLVVGCCNRIPKKTDVMGRGEGENIIEWHLAFSLFSSSTTLSLKATKSCGKFSLGIEKSLSQITFILGSSF